MPKLRWIVVLAGLLSSALAGTALAGRADPFNVLVLHAYHDGIPWQASVEKGIRDAIEDDGTPIRLFVERLDKARFRNTVDEGLFARFLERKYASRRPDLVIATAYEAVVFLQEHREAFGSAKFVYVTSNTKGIEDDPDTASVQVPVAPDHRTALELALKLHPGTHRVLVVGEDTKGGRRHVENVEAAAARLSRSVEFEFVTDYAMDDLLARVAKLPGGAVVYALLVFRDKTGARFVPRQVVGRISEHASVPVYSHWETLLGTGAVGGYMIGGELAGQAAAKAGLGLLRGAAGATVTPSESLGHYFDWRQLQRWGIDESSLPRGSQVRHRVLSDFEKYFWHIVAIGIFTVVQAALILWLLASRRQRQRALALMDEARLRAEHASRAKSDFLANMSHELRTPLNAILGFADMLRHGIIGPLQPAKYGDYVDDIHRSGSHLLNLINEILDMSKIEAGEYAINPEPLDFADLIGDAVLLVGGQAEDKGIVLDTEVPEDLARIHADRRSAVQILINLLTNAIKFTPAGGTVTVRAAERDGALAVEVADTGVGMGPGEVERALKPFVQIEREKGRSHEGTGLGLPLCHKLVELQGGAFSLASTPGKGTIASFTLPLSGAAPSSTRSRPSRDAVPVAWTPSMSVGIEKWDSDHRTLLALIGVLRATARAPDRAVQAGAVLETLMRYMETHLVSEETVMGETGYPALEAHKAAHDGFRAWLAAERVSFRTAPDTWDAVAAAEYLSEWWYEHILKVDMAYRDYFEAHRAEARAHMADYAGVGNADAHV